MNSTWMFALSTIAHKLCAQREWERELLLLLLLFSRRVWENEILQSSCWATALNWERVGHPLTISTDQLVPMCNKNSHKEREKVDVTISSHPRALLLLLPSFLPSFEDDHKGECGASGIVATKITSGTSKKSCQSKPWKAVGEDHLSEHRFNFPLFSLFVLIHNKIFSPHPSITTWAIKIVQSPSPSPAHNNASFCGRVVLAQGCRGQSMVLANLVVVQSKPVSQVNCQNLFPHQNWNDIGCLNLMALLLQAVLLWWLQLPQ